VPDNGKEEWWEGSKKINASDSPTTTYTACATYNKRTRGSGIKANSRWIMGVGPCVIIDAHKAVSNFSLSPFFRKVQVFPCQTVGASIT
jgi:hypothetical protein